MFKINPLKIFKKFCVLNITNEFVFLQLPSILKERIGEYTQNGESKDINSIFY